MKGGDTDMINLQEKKAILKVSHSGDGYTKILVFNFMLPVLDGYEVEFEGTLSSTEGFPRYFSSGIDMKYSQGMLYLHVECQDEEGFELRVEDAERSYKAICFGSEEALSLWKKNGIYNTSVNQIDTEGIDVSVIE
jgi:hypothetical protein